MSDKTGDNASAETAAATTGTDDASTGVAVEAGKTKEVEAGAAADGTGTTETGAGKTGDDASSAAVATALDAFASVAELTETAWFKSQPDAVRKTLKDNLTKTVEARVAESTVEWRTKADRMTKVLELIDDDSNAAKEMVAQNSELKKTIEQLNMQLTDLPDKVRSEEQVKLRAELDAEIKGLNDKIKERDEKIQAATAKLTDAEMSIQAREWDTFRDELNTAAPELLKQADGKPLHIKIIKELIEVRNNPLFIDSPDPTRAALEFMASKNPKLREYVKFAKTNKPDSGISFADIDTGAKSSKPTVESWDSIQARIKGLKAHA